MKEGPQSSQFVRTSRKTWRISEVETAEHFEPEALSQVSFRDGNPTSTGAKGSVRPDLYTKGRSIEVKNYLIGSTGQRRRLIAIIRKQAIKRARHLPKGTRQTVRLDLQGQVGVDDKMRVLAIAIEEATNGLVLRQDVHWILSLYPTTDAQNTTTLVEHHEPL